MTAVDHAELKRLAEGAIGEPWGSITSGPKLSRDEILVRVTDDRDWPVVAEHILAANPATVLALLSEIEGLKSYVKDATNEALEYRRQLDALRTQAPDSWRPIETAPKDGTNFDSQDRTNYGKRVFTKTHWYVHPSVQGWVTDEIDCGDYEFEPTHWRPSALCPQTAESGK